MRRWTTLAGLIATVAAAVVGIAPAASAAACPSVGGNWAGPGPFAVTQASNGAGTTIFQPTGLGSLGCGTHPVLLWGNGGAATPQNYVPLLTHFASHGFIVAAYEAQSADPKFLLSGLDYLTQQNSTAGSPFAGKVDLARVGATGHSLGGGQAVGAGADPRVDTVAPILGGPFNDPAKLHGPAFFTAGQNDLIVWSSVVHGQYEKASQVPAIFAELRGAGHFLNGDAGGLRGPVTAWFRYHLMGDTQARGLFFGPNCGYCGPSEWSKFERNAKASAF
ncbi:poly(ethylene terephthalate) hydrolase family protein [Kibdelosporangium aridum]|uniref:PET hydrolase/cutinase-like domain-containing protein n=1 Tax=Kibdelosporangium aridum TaxID=2030 RepID=A0A1Y5XXE4_KIBAR|nr:acetylxylan esterase [Kibdelosporangium aridum]SMD18890.1 hypothetical protein SAMN05661093_05945 [Kibdelosporangium aridum]